MHNDDLILNAQEMLEHVSGMPLTYMGASDTPPADAGIGSVYINTTDNTSYVLADDWIGMGSISVDYGYNRPQEVKLVLATCDCCGAPLNGDRCEYCGSTYRRVYVD